MNPTPRILDEEDAVMEARAAVARDEELHDLESDLAQLHVERDRARRWVLRWMSVARLCATQRDVLLTEQSGLRSDLADAIQQRNSAEETIRRQNLQLEHDAAELRLLRGQLSDVSRQCQRLIEAEQRRPLLTAANGNGHHVAPAQTIIQVQAGAFVLVGGAQQ